MKTKTGKTATLFIVGIMALACVSASYALWYEDLIIDGTVTTGTFSAEWSLPEPLEYGDNDDGGKDVADITYIHLIDWETCQVTIENAYPFYEAWFKIGIVCRGNIPLHVKEIIYDGPDCIEVWLDPDPLNDPRYPDGIAQIHQFGEYFTWVHIRIIEDDNAEPPIDPEQDHTYMFTLTVRTIQYNYVPSG